MNEIFDQYVSNSDMRHIGEDPDILVQRLRGIDHNIETNEICQKAADRIEQLEQDLLEQCRLNGMGSEREAALRGKVDRLERELAAAKDLNRDLMAESFKRDAELAEFGIEMIGKLNAELQAKCAELERERDYEKAVNESLLTQCREYGKQCAEYTKRIAAMEAQAGEPVAWYYDNKPYGENVTLEDRSHDSSYIPLYTHPSIPECKVQEGFVLVPIEPSEEMIAAYLEANKYYWQCQDQLPLSNPSKWRNGTPKEATVEGYKAMIVAAQKGDV